MMKKNEGGDNKNFAIKMFGMNENVKLVVFM